MKNIGLITYSNTVMKDAWPVYFGQVEKHLKGIRSYAFFNESYEKASSKNHTVIVYNNDDPYYKQYLGCLEKVNEDYVIYAQEDFFLIGDVTLESLQKYCNFLDSSDYSFVRLIRSGYETPLDVHVERDMYEVNVNTADAFAMQATLWKKEKLIELYSHVKSEKWYEGDHWNTACSNLSIKGVFTYNGEKMIGRYHYDSIVYPYVCTAINKGRWNMHLYGETLRRLFDEYGIDPSDRGMRLSQSHYTK